MGSTEVQVTKPRSSNKIDARSTRLDGDHNNKNKGQTIGIFKYIQENK